MGNLKDIQNMTSKLLFFDLETTGVKFWRNRIHQIGGIVDIDGQEAERFDIRLALNPAATIEQEALDVAGVTLGASAVLSAYGRRIQAVSWYIIQIRE